MIKKLIEKAFENTAVEYSANASGQGKDLARITKAMAITGADTVEVVTGIINLLVVDPLKGSLYLCDKLKDNFIPKVKKYLDDIPKENIITPDEAIAGPILEAVKFKTDSDISELFAALLASAMDSKKKDLVHPAYIQIISELSSDEAKILKFLNEHKIGSYPIIDLHSKPKNEISKKMIFRNFTDLGYKALCNNLGFVPAYIDNMERLKLIDIPSDTWMTDKTEYAPLTEHPELNVHKEQIIKLGQEVSIKERVLTITPFGFGFLKSIRLIS
ncbi:MAG: DUF4393 domain-containing protein [Alphaproteobacteria bacterium]|jgi:hypothetical protein